MSPEGRQGTANGGGAPGRTRVLLIDPTDPWITHNEALKHHEQVLLPIGLMSLSASLKARLGDRVEVRVVSTIVDVDGPEGMRALLREYAPDVVGIRCIIFYAEEVARIAADARRLLPGALLVAGGPNVTSGDEALRSDPSFDVLVHGEGEETLCELVEPFARGGRAALEAALPGVRGALHRRDGRLVVNPPRDPIADLDRLPHADYTAIDLPRYGRFLNYGYNRRPMGILFTSRGCPWRCTYCHNVFGKEFRARSAADVHREIEELNARHGIADFAIIDDNFTVDRRRVEELCRLLLERGPKVRFYFPNGIRADSLDAALLETLKRAGTIYATFSLETASPRLQKALRKNADVEKLRAIVEHSCRIGLITNLCVMVGFPSETFDEAMETLVHFSKYEGLVLPYYFSLKYYPGTEIFRTARDHGIEIRPASYRDPYHGYEFQETPLLSRKDFEKLNQWYLRHIFLNPRRLRNAVDTLRRHFTEEEIKDMFTLFFRRRIADVERDVMSAAVA